VPFEMQSDMKAMKMMRRAFVAGTAAVVGSGHAFAASSSPAEFLSDLSTRAYAALMTGDAEAFSSTLKHHKNFTLMQPFGRVVHGLDTSPAHLQALGNFFRNGSFRQEQIQTITSDDVAVLVTVEHQFVEVGGLPPQEWPLRVTLVFRRSDGEWQLAHRHADPLVHGISLEQAAALARGAS
jgi:ketosteroid isomerase-like protein